MHDAGVFEGTCSGKVVRKTVYLEQGVKDAHDWRRGLLEVPLASVGPNQLLDNAALIPVKQLWERYSSGGAAVHPTEWQGSKSPPRTIGGVDLAIKVPGPVQAALLQGDYRAGVTLQDSCYSLRQQDRCRLCA